MSTETIWLGIGFLGQGLFFGRWLVQWIASERSAESRVPISFWYMSLIGGLITLTYAIYRRGSRLYFRQGLGAVVYLATSSSSLARIKPKTNLGPSHEQIDAQTVVLPFPSPTDNGHIPHGSHLCPTYTVAAPSAPLRSAFFTALGSMGLTDRDEGRNAEAGREMFASGDLVTPTFNGELRVAKPVFVYWLMTLSYHVFGVNEFAARAPSALFGVGLILMHYLFLSRLRGPTVGLFGALMLLLNIEVLALGRMAITDSVLIFFTTLSLYGFWLGLSEPGRGRHWIWAFYAGIALATLTKGPVGLALR